MATFLWSFKHIISENTSANCHNYGQFWNHSICMFSVLEVSFWCLNQWKSAFTSLLELLDFGGHLLSVHVESGVTTKKEIQSYKQTGSPKESWLMVSLCWLSHWLYFLTAFINQSPFLEQWRVSKIIPVHKKGSKQCIENYRPVANLCSSSKIFDRLILNRINQLELLGKIDLTGNGQPGFKKNS